MLIEVPLDRAVLPPGYYMVFAIAEGIPSKGTFTRVAD
jgi:hypothetical protein